MRLSQVMRAEGLEPTEATLILHRPTPLGLRRRLPWIAAERPGEFDAYQNVHSRPAQATLRGRPVTLSFVTVAEGRLAFAGAFSVTVAGERSLREILADPHFGILRREREATRGPAREDEDDEEASRPESLRLVFRLGPLAAMAALKGRLVIPASGTRAYVRLVESYNPNVLAIAEASLLTPSVPGWRDMVLRTDEVRDLPGAWAARLTDWQSIYLIVDESDGARYVGSASGAGGFLARWRQHVAREAEGITAKLRERDPSRFRFSILERVVDMAQRRSAAWSRPGWTGFTPVSIASTRAGLPWRNGTGTIR